MSKALTRYALPGLLFLAVAGISTASVAAERKGRPDPFLQKLTDLPEMLPHKPPIPQRSEGDLASRKMSARLQRVVAQRAALREKRGRLPLSDAERRLLDREETRVIFHTADGHSVDLDALEAHGSRILRVRGNSVGAVVPIDRIADIVTHVAGIQYARAPHRFFPAEVVGEGVGVSGAADLHASGFTGSGVRVAILDVGFLDLSEAQASGDMPMPQAIIGVDYSGEGLETRYRHGTGCAEIVHEMAPDAELHLLKVGDELDLHTVTEYCVEKGIDIVSMSIGTFGSGPGDGTGPISEGADELLYNGVLLVAAAGNQANSGQGTGAYGRHWKGAFLDSDGDDRHEFIQGDPASWRNVVTAYPHQDDEGNPETDDVSILMRWDDWPNSSIDYNLYLYNYYTNALVESSDTIQDGQQPPVEHIVVDLLDHEDPQAYYVVVTRVSGEPSGVEIELFLGGTSFFVPSPGQSLPIATSESSIIEPADAESALAVGAINYANWETGPQEGFSSQGPTNAWAGSGARTKPDICGPDGVSGIAYGSSAFLGTSAATPHVAGAAALILSVRPDLRPDELRAAIESMAVDMGTEGKDNLYGWGRLTLDEGGIPPLLGDVNGDGVSDLGDLILCLRALAGLDSSLVRDGYGDSDTDVNKDSRIGLEEAIFIIRRLAGL